MVLGLLDRSGGGDGGLNVVYAPRSISARSTAFFSDIAQLLAAPSHPCIAAIFGLEESAGVRAIVMELVDGPTLAERIVAGPLPIVAALRIARQIAEALEYAHERGVVHRDLKPANVKLTADSAVKVLDFGLAKALERTPVGAGLANSPTLSLAATQAGTILGTAAYMSPEQARGGATDRRADVWAFGCVLFELLTGQQAFSGHTVSDTLAAVLRAESNWTLVPADTPRSIRTLLKRCLDKDPKRRLHDIADARIEIEDALSAPEGEPGAATTVRVSGWRHALPFATAACAGAVVAAATGWLFVRSTRTIEAPAVRRLTIGLPSDARVFAGTSFALSPDGRTLVYTGQQQLYRRALDGFLIEPIRGSERARAPFFSPDGQWVGFNADDKLKIRVVLNWTEDLKRLGRR